MLPRIKVSKVDLVRLVKFEILTELVKSISNMMDGPEDIDSMVFLLGFTQTIFLSGLGHEDADEVGYCEKLQSTRYTI